MKHIILYYQKCQETNILEGLDRLASGERFFSNRLRNYSDIFFKTTFLTQWTRAVQGGAFTSGIMLIRRNLQKLYDHKMGIAKLTEGDFRGLGMNKKSYLEKQIKDSRCSIFPLGGDIREIDILNKAMEGVDYVISLAAMWLLHCKDYPRTAFDVNIAGTFNILEACVKNNIKKLRLLKVYGFAGIRYFE